VPLEVTCLETGYGEITREGYAPTVTPPTDPGPDPTAPSEADRAPAEAAALLEACRRRGAGLVIAESCTGGLLTATLTSVPGASAVLERAYVTYADAAKVEDLGVAPAALTRHGAVSEPVARAMAEGARARGLGPATLGLAATGIAGPGGGTPEKPVGTVWVAAAFGGQVLAMRHDLGPGTRAEIRIRTLLAALRLARELVEGASA
jgi:nicotinamide-nucleotide amidase